MDTELNLSKNWPRVLLGFVVMVLVAGVVFATARQYLGQNRGDVTVPGSTIELKKNEKKGEGAMTEEEKEKPNKLPGTSGEETVTILPGEGWIKLAKRVCDDPNAADALSAQHPEVKMLNLGQELSLRCP